MISHSIVTFQILTCAQVPKGLPYTFNMYSGLPLPVVLFQEPLLAEICGAGFTKAPQSKVGPSRPQLLSLDGLPTS